MTAVSSRLMFWHLGLMEFTLNIVLLKFIGYGLFLILIAVTFTDSRLQCSAGEPKFTATERHVQPGNCIKTL